LAKENPELNAAIAGMLPADREICYADRPEDALMKTLGISTFLGVLLGGTLIYLVDFQNPASKVLTITLSVGLVMSTVSLVGKMIGQKKPPADSKGAGDAS
jgi:hypothetical protein